MYKYESCCKPFKADLALLLVLLLCMIFQRVLIVKVLLTRLTLDLVHVCHVILKTCHCGKFLVAFCASFGLVHILGKFVEVCKHHVAVAAFVRGVPLSPLSPQSTVLTLSTVYAMSTVSTVSTVTAVYSAVLPPSLMEFFSQPTIFPWKLWTGK